MEKKKQYRELCRTVADIEVCVNDDNRESKKVRELLRKAEKLLDIKIDKEQPLKRQLTRAIEDVAARMNEAECDELTNMPLYTGNENYRMPKEYYAHAIELPFENTTIAVPAHYDALLTKKYGPDWMKPVRSGGSHGYPAYENVHRGIRDEVGIEPLQYFYSKEEIEAVENERAPKETMQERVSAFLPLFHEAHEELAGLLAEGRKDEAAGLLGECQNVAIELGTLIETERGSGHPTVSVLEKYCEQIFQIHEGLAGGYQEGQESGGPVESDGCAENIAERTSCLRAFEKELQESIAQNLKEKREVVFLPYKTDCWWMLEEMWRRAVADEEVEVTVIPVPYYYKDDFGSVIKDEPQYETDYPEEVKITSYESYDFAAHRPDVIVMQFPFDEYSYGSTIHPFFYAQNIKKYTDRLVWIPPFAMDEIGPGDERGRKTLRNLCRTPGAAYADTLLVQSEQMKDVYVELLTEFAGEETESMWKEKISVWEPLLSDERNRPLRIVGEKGVPEEWLEIIRKPDGSEKKVILYVISASVLFQYGVKAVEKMREVFGLFREHKDDIAVIWRPDMNARELLRRSRPEAWPGYRDLLQEYREGGWGIYDDSPDAERAVKFCDAYYGDGSAMANKCHVLKKPVMIQNVSIRDVG